jgi:hypothetical protein
MGFAIFVDEGFDIGKIVGFTRNRICLQPFEERILNNRVDRPLFQRRQVMRQIPRTRRTDRELRRCHGGNDSGVMA